MQTVIGKFVFGIQIGEKTYTDFEIREPLVSDMVDAETEVPPTDLHAFNVQLLCRVLVRVGDFTGPFTPVMLMRLKRHDYNALMQAVIKADALGKPVPSEEPTA